MMKKRRTALTAVLMMSLALAACGSNRAGSADTGATSAPAAASGEETAAEEAATDAGSGETESPAETANSFSAEGFVRGVITETSYESSMLGIRYDAPEDYMILDEEMMQQVMQIATAMSSEETAELLAQGQAVVDFYTMNAQNGWNASIAFESLDVMNQSLVMAGAVSIEDIMDANLASYRQIFESQGATGVEVVRTETSFLGQPTPCVQASMTVNNVLLFQKLIYIVSRDGAYLGALTVTTNGEDATQTILDCFTAIP
ncbi:MAG: hypothetical protein IJQ12_02455 [Lachnospiraceae bacterium]|nr:hypothetical protein [Lachnospiraceae bacterium]